MSIIIIFLDKSSKHVHFISPGIDYYYKCKRLEETWQQELIAQGKDVLRKHLSGRIYVFELRSML